MKKCIYCGGTAVDENFVCSNCGFSPNKDGLALSFLNGKDLKDNLFDPSTYKEYAKTEVRNFWYISRAKLCIIMINKYLNNGGCFLEVGCGTGYILHIINQRLPKLKLYGADIYAEGFEFVKKRLQGNVILLQIDAENVPFKHHFDLIGAFDVLEHVEDEGKILSEVYKALKPGGLLMLAAPQYMSLWSMWDEINCHKRRYARGQLAMITESVGFVIERETSFVFFLLPFIYLKRLFGRNKKSLRPTEENEINFFLNKIFSVVMFFERILIGFGFSLPFGSSVFIMARKPASDISDKIEQNH
jgi:SAM-dependent methyltransferase